MADDLSKYGTVGDDDMAKYGEFTAAPSAAQPPTAPGSLIPEPVKRFASNALAAVNPLPGLSEMASESTNPQIGLKKTIESHFFQPQADQFHQAASVMRGEGEGAGMGLPARLSMAGGHALAGALPLVGPVAARAGEQIASGDVAGGLGSGAGLVGSMLAPSAIRGTGRSLSAAAEPIAEHALGIRNVDRAPSKNPGRAVLDLTHGVRPSTVAGSAGDAIADLSQSRDALLNSSQTPVSLAPARQVIADAMARGRLGNSDMSHLSPMASQLHEPVQGFGGATIQPPTPQIPNPAYASSPTAPPTIAGRTPPPVIADTQLPRDFLPIRQRFGEDFTKFDTARPLSNEALRVGNQAYRGLTNELHSAVPASAPIDQSISNLIPARDAAKATNLKEGMAGSVMSRIGARTGGLIAGGLLGHEMGSPIIGTALGAVAPEFLSSPTVQMAGARALDTAGKIAAFNRAKGLAAPSLPLSAPLMVKRQTQ